MLSRYEILKASKTGIAPDMRTALAGMNWGGADSGHEVKELTGIPPLSIRSNGTMLLDYLISGNMSQSGTPTPDNPIQPQECGDLETTGTHAGQYKIPISSANTTTNIYLSEVETTRQIKKLVLTGQENWKYLGDGFAYLNTITDYSKVNGNISICTHFRTNSSVTSAEYVINGISFYNAAAENYRLYIKDSTLFTTITTLKSYLAQQYAAGTPVIVWYVLATPETAVVNEPLRKIGDYADTVSGITIPTIAGTNTIDVDTTLKPSEVSVNYHGWHPITDIHRFNGTSWD